MAQNFNWWSAPLKQRVAAYNQAKKTNANIAPIMYFTEAELRYMRAAGAPTGAWVDKVKKDYPSYVDYLNQPEIADVLHKSIDRGLNPAETLSQLQQTTWWRNRTETQRQWVLQGYQDPHTQFNSMMHQYVEIQRSAQLLGINPPANFMMGLADDVLSGGADQEQVMDALANWAFQHNDFNDGVLGATMDSVIQKSHDYLIPMSEKGAAPWARDIVSNRSNMDAFTTSIKDWAKARFGDKGIRDAIDRGMTVREYADPYVQAASKLLGVNPGDINMEDSKWISALDWADPANKGQRRAQTLDEWNRNLRTDSRYGYDFSDTAKDEAAQFVSNLQNLFGKA